MLREAKGFLKFCHEKEEENRAFLTVQIRL